MSAIEDFLSGPYGWLSIFAIIIFFTVVTIAFYYRKDKYDPEPLNRIFLAFGYGLLSVIPALIFSIIASVLLASFTGLDTTTSFFAIMLSVLVAPPVEEITKGWFVIRLSKSEEFDGPLDGLIYGAMVGAGFAAAENLLYGFSAFTADDLFAGAFIATVRSLTQIIGHPFYTGLFGVGVGEAKVGLSQDKYNRLLRVIILHALWNTAASLSGVLIWIGLAAIIAISIYYLRKELKRAIELDRDAYERGYYEQKRRYLEAKRKRIREQIRAGPQSWQNQTPSWERQQTQWPQHPTQQQPQVWQRQSQQGGDQWQKQPMDIPPWERQQQDFGGRMGPKADTSRDVPQQPEEPTEVDKGEEVDPTRSLWSEEKRKADEQSDKKNQDS